jgi:hypothetical protein
MFPLQAFYWGQKGARDNYGLQIQNIVEESYKSLGETPVLIGECGVPMDIKYVLSQAYYLELMLDKRRRGICIGELWLSEPYDGRCVNGSGQGPCWIRVGGQFQLYYII